MNTQKMISTLAMTMTVVTLITLPLTVSIAVLLSSIGVIAIHHFLQTHQINYQYWLSFFSQLMALILIAGSFLLMLSASFNWINH